ncbi:hypothetical protein SFC43_00545 [Bacteroides sp. CR5/BHMF/2]|nr:hypothetical protein [Bacteroides sp. CR5/BHMF/2]
MGYLIPSFSFIDIPAEGVEVSIDNVNDIYSGVVWQKYSDYTTEDGEPSSLSWKTCVSFLQAYNMIGASRKTLLTLKNGEYSLFKGGYFIINIAYKMSGSFLPNDIIKTSDEAYSNTKYGAGFDNTTVPCKLYIDDYYYDGEVWRNRKYYTDRVARGYYKSTNNLTYQGQYGIDIKTDSGIGVLSPKANTIQLAAKRLPADTMIEIRSMRIEKMAKIFLSRNGIMTNVYLKTVFI